MIDKNLDKQNSKYAKLMQLDKEMDDALVAAANKALKAVQPAIEPEPKSITRRTRKSQPAKKRVPVYHVA